MANIWTGSLPKDSDYEDLATLSEQTFTNGDTLQIQIQNPAYIREGSTGDGFLVTGNKPFNVTYGSDTIYVKSLSQDCVINISDTQIFTF